MMGRFLNLLDFSLLSFRRNKLKNGGLFLVFTITVFFLASFQLLSTSLQRLSGELLEYVPDITVQQMSAGRQVNLNPEDLNGFESIYGIKQMRQRVWGYYFDESNGANYTVVGLDWKNPQPTNKQLPDLATGRYPEPGEAGKAVLGTAVKESLELGNRKFFTLFKPDLNQKSFETIGTFSKSLDILSGDMILVTLEDARELFNIPSNHITDLLIDSANPDEIDNMAKKIQENNPSTRVVTKNQMRKTYTAIFGWRSGIGGITLLGGIIAFMILAWEKSSGFSKEEKRETAILRSIGWQTGDLMTVRFLEAFILSMTAFLTGFFLAWFHLLWFKGTLFRPLLLGWSVLKPELSIPPVFQPSDLMLLFSLAVIPYWCATIVPIWKASVTRLEKEV